ncbi:hypothetical protein AX17_005224 [Amanita inopinata Kibby_2008]|nr:hypothetical protein AX17_005224 [Amanita inopinata Kibby_2008]
MLASALRSTGTRQNLYTLRIGRRNYASSSKCTNHAIVQMLLQEREKESRNGEKNGYKLRAFSNAVKAIEQLDRPITSAKDALQLRGIGIGIADRIGDFLDATNEQPNRPWNAAHNSKKLRMRLLRDELLKLPSIGYDNTSFFVLEPGCADLSVTTTSIKKAEQLIVAGCTSMADLHSRKFQPMLSKKQKVYVKYAEHLDEPITREQAETVARFIQDNLSSRYEVILAGDYRRGLDTFPVLEIILLHPEHVQMPIPDPPQIVKESRRLAWSSASKQTYLSMAKKIPNPLHGGAMPTLYNRGLVCDVTMNGERKWCGVIRIPELVEGMGADGEETTVWSDKYERVRAITLGEGLFRQVNMTIAPQKARAATLLSLTGDHDFVKYIRRKAVSLGLYLDEFGLWRWHGESQAMSMPDGDASEKNGAQSEDGNGRTGGNYWELMQVSREEDIFAVLGMEYVEPARRNFAFLKRAGKA